MIDWKVILFIVLLVLGIGYLWFYNIRWTIRFWSKKSLNKTINEIHREEINDTQNDKRYYKPEPKSLRNIEGLNCLTNCEGKPYNACTTKDNYKRPNPPIIFTHIKRIISRIKRLCNQKRIIPFNLSRGV